MTHWAMRKEEQDEQIDEQKRRYQAMRDDRDNWIKLADSRAEAIDRLEAERDRLREAVRLAIAAYRHEDSLAILRDALADGGDE